MQVCRICLATDRKMYSLDSDRIRSYEQITGGTYLKIRTSQPGRQRYIAGEVRHHRQQTADSDSEWFVSDDLLPKYVCWECGYYLSKYVAFKSKAEMSQKVLQWILSTGGLINQKAIESINREHFNLQSNLNYTDLICLCVDEEEESHVDIDADVKRESDDNDEHFGSLKGHFADDSIDDIQDFNNDRSVNPTEEMNDIDTDSVKRSNDFYNKYENSNSLFEDNVESNGKSSKQNSYDKRRRKSRAFQVDLDMNSDVNIADLTENCTNIEKLATQKDAKKNIKGSKNAKEIIKKSKKDFVNDENTKRLRDMKRVAVLDKVDKAILNLTKLSPDEQITEMEKRKLDDKYRHYKFKCTFCFRGFLDDEKLNRHMEKHSESQGDYACNLCKLRYVTRYKLNVHMKTHLYRITCRQCNFSTSTLNVAMKHQNYHKGKEFVCPHCKEIYTHVSTYLSHLRIKHTSNAICQYCGHSFINERGLLFHKKYLHRSDQTPIPEDGPYCERCDIRFLSQSALDTHKQLSDKHDDERKATEQNELKKKDAKRRSRPTSEPFVDGPKSCEQCDAQLANPRAYFIHFLKEHKDKNRTLFYARKPHRYMCEICGKMFQATANLRDHQYVHSDTKQFKCERCDRLFQQKAHLKVHQTHHCGSRRPYPCNVCAKVFTNYSNMKRHMVSHTGVRAYKCEMCDKTFVNSGNKKNHIDFVHMKKPWPKRNRGARKRTQRQTEIMQQNPCEAVEMQEEWNSAS